MENVNLQHVKSCSGPYKERIRSRIFVNYFLLSGPTLLFLVCFYYEPLLYETGNCLLCNKIIPSIWHQDYVGILPRAPKCQALGYFLFKI